MWGGDLDCVGVVVLVGDGDLEVVDDGGGDGGVGRNGSGMRR